MPRSFNDQEITQIRADLMDAGKELFTVPGLKKTSIDDLVQKVRIAKGSFYKFFPSKEILYLEILEQEEKNIRLSMETLNLTGEELTEAKLKAFFSGIG